MGRKQSEIEKEFERMKPGLKQILGSTCCACGETDNIQYHHILPVILGGDNRLTNIVPICAECHSKIHGIKALTSYAENTGRPKNAPKGDYKTIIRKYLTGEIGMEQAKTMLGLRDGARASEQWYYKEYLNELGIKKINRSGAPGYSNSLILFVDGHMELWVNGEMICRRRDCKDADDRTGNM